MKTYDKKQVEEAWNTCFNFPPRLLSLYRKQIIEHSNEKQLHQAWQKCNFPELLFRYFFDELHFEIERNDIFPSEIDNYRKQIGVE